ncbi:hypothetical protein GGR52DRAFT_573958 [Hypoxylon sp. FL1284]|nr:hypothetical protein GGR52DRAFT_573958 [Hypoxylon sp. FL1284]
MAELAPIIAAGDDVLSETARRCLEAKDGISFVIGPPRFGKSTKLPFLLATLKKQRVICVQPDVDAARRHAEYVSDQYQGFSVGVCEDSVILKPTLKLGNQVTYMSCALLRRVISQAWMDKCEGNVRQDEVVCAIVMDEVHAQTVQQELAYIKVVLATAYPAANPFENCFDLSTEQIEKRTLRVSLGEAPAPTEATFVEEAKEVQENTGTAKLAAHNYRAKEIVNSILHRNPKANVLVMLLEGRGLQAEIIQTMTPAMGAKLYDLRESNTQAVNGRDDEGCVVVAVPDYASRIPVEGITDVVAPGARIHDTYDERLCKNVSEQVPLHAWELEFVKNHLDPKLEARRIHYAFPQSHVVSTPEPCVRFLNTDCVEYWLSILRMLDVDKAVADNTPVRLIPTLAKTELTSLQFSFSLGLLLDQGPFGAVMPGRDKIIFDLMDRAGIEYRAAVFLGELLASVRESTLGSDEKDAIVLIGILLHVFDRDPVLKRRTYDAPLRIEDLGLGDSAILDPGYMSDAWVNAAYWMCSAKVVSREGIDSLRPRGFFVKRREFGEAKAKIERLASCLGVNQSRMAELTNGSFLKRVCDDSGDLSEGGLDLAGNSKGLGVRQGEGLPL